MENPILDNITTLYKDKKWKDIIYFLNTCDVVDIRKLLWVSPNVKEIFWITRIITENNLKGIISVGCGSGLLEWLIQQNSDCDVVGVEIDQSWWCSRYSPPNFLKNMIFISDPESVVEVPENYALLFCYFNNGPVFLKYLQEYKGNIILVIGPDAGQNRYTNPLPFDQQFTEYGWRLSNSHEILLSKDYICMYVR